MTRRSARRHATLAMGAIVALSLGFTGCAKQIASVDPGYVSPEGTPSSKARLIVTPDIPVPYEVYLDAKNDGLTEDDSLDVLSPYDFYASGPGAVIGTIFDSTLASAYQVLRREANGGYRLAQDFSQHPVRKWLDTEWEAYTFVDPAPSGFQPPTYLGRGILSGVVTAESPLTNAAMTASGGIADLKFDYQGLYTTIDLRSGIDTYNPLDSANISVKWTPVAGAAGYWISVFESKTTGSAAELLGNTLPAPIPLKKLRHFLLAYVSAPASSYIAFPTAGETADFIVTSHPIVNKQYYRLRITAVGPDGAILGYTMGDNLVVMPGAPRQVGASPQNTWYIAIEGAIRLRPGVQVETAPQEAADPIRALPARPGPTLLRGDGLSP
jgi:hypothetical protein